MFCCSFDYWWNNVLAGIGMTSHKLWKFAQMFCYPSLFCCKRGFLLPTTFCIFSCSLVFTSYYFPSDFFSILSSDFFLKRTTPSGKNCISFNSQYFSMTLKGIKALCENSTKSFGAIRIITASYQHCFIDLA